ncbi:MAG TPA: hypothetical protein VJH03_06865 [Blastocatellia bacterium]|nr:hypothetical protein [Blastocatellia bacterium]
MLLKQSNIRLVLMMGQAVPLPAPSAVMNALSRVEVTNDSHGSDGFQISFNISKSQPMDYDLLQSGLLTQGTRVIIGVLLGAMPQVLIDGIIAHHQVAPSAEPGASTLSVTGKDVSVMMDLEEKNASYENQSDDVIVTQLIGAYAQYGLVPKTGPTTYTPLATEHTPRQAETDLKFIQRMAQRNGYVFYVEPVTFNVNTAYWGPENRVTPPQPRLTMGVGVQSNLKSLSFSQDSLAPVMTQGSFIEETSGQTIPIPPIPPLRVPPFVTTPTPALRTVLMRDTANQSALQAVISALAAALKVPDSVTGSGEVDTVRYGSILRARRLVNVRGAGLSYDGLYYVSRVTHTITRGDYKQSFSISREGTGALLPVVMP